VAKSLRPDSRIPKQPIDRLVGPIVRFLHVEAASGAVLMACTVFALAAANSTRSESYVHFWNTAVGFTFGEFEFQHSLKHLINDGLMAIFFFVIGLEVKREIVLGELGDLKRAALPIAAALGGMVVPAAVYLGMQFGQPASRGWGIPMATDIAFVVGCMAVLGSRVPHSLRILLLSLAIVDDIGAILVIAIGYTSDLSWNWLLVASVGIVVVRLLAIAGVRRIPVYVAAGVVVWFAFHESGVHATIAGVILGMMTPTTAIVRAGVFGELLQQAREIFEGGEWDSQSHRAEKVRSFQAITRETISPLEYLENTLHPWSGFVIMPVFALANAGVPLQIADLNDSVAVSVMLGLVVGKPVGIVAFSWLAVKLGWARLPEDIRWSTMAAAGCLAGIGFTMALFIAGLALTGDALDTAKVGVLCGSGISALLGMGMLLGTLSNGANKPR